MSKALPEMGVAETYYDSVRVLGGTLFRSDGRGHALLISKPSQETSESI